MTWQPGPDGKNGRMVWQDDLAPTLERFGSLPHLPQPSELVREPLSFLEPGPDPDGRPVAPLAGIPFRPGLGAKCKHGVGDGVSARDKWRIYSQLVPALQDFAAPEPPHRRILLPARIRSTALSLLHVDHHALTRAAGRSIELGLWCDTTVIRDEALQAASLALDLPLADGQPDHLEPFRRSYQGQDGLEVVLRVEPVGALADDLELDPSLKPGDRLKDAAVARQTQVRARMGSSTGHDARFALVEMRNADGFTSAQHDPKMAVRSGAASCGIVVQNVTPPRPEGTDPGQESAGARTERVRKAVSDLLIRSTGMVKTPTYQGSKDNELGDVSCVGLWVVRRTSDFKTVMPLAVGTVPGQAHATVRLPDRGWMPYHQAMIELAGWHTSRTFGPKDIQGFFTDVVHEVCDGSATALFTLAQNIRAACPGLNNPNLTPDRLAFDPDRALDPQKYKGLRHVRVRTNVSRETAQHYAHGPGEVTRAGVGSGLWASGNERVFFSTADKPVTAGPGSPNGSRLEHHWGKNHKREEVWKLDVSKDVWNPQLVELAVALHQDGDEPAAWAALAHQRRCAAAHFADPLTLPIELHLAYKLGSYMLPAHLLEPIEQSES